MWRQNFCKENHGFDDSISDEEEFDSGLPVNGVSLGGQEGLQLQSRLDILKGIHQLDYGEKTSNLPHETLACFGLEDEVEVPDSSDESDFTQSPSMAFACNSEEEVISDDEVNNVGSIVSITSGTTRVHKDHFHSLGSVKQDGEHTWSEVSKEAEALIHLNEKASCALSNSANSKANRSFKGIKGRAKPKFSFRLHSTREGLSCHSKDENDVSSKVHDVPKGLEAVDHETFKRSIAEVPEDFDEEEEKHSDNRSTEVLALGHRLVQHSMAELLDGLQDNACLLRENSKMFCRKKGKKVQLVKRSMSCLGNETLDSEDLLDSMSSPSSSENEANHQSLVIAIPEMKRKTIADQFQEALGSTNMNDEGGLVVAHKSTGVGLFVKLQQVLLSEKERDEDFMKNLQIGTSPNNDSSCINVKILSRYLDAKLIVCQCSSSNNIEAVFDNRNKICQWPDSLQVMKNGEWKKTIIFNSRVCTDVDLEVGSFIRIHPPWKEVQVIGNDEGIVLCTYFSPIST
ncbi:hypothetical protein CFOL_v3_32376 [Cephalotus follicularis]|uniref:Uncharacterized protein n=1 Tax=Cephalotus follicularis TaxID=3775 RepID=A0A1Q3D941_CEPFO|nr:hypothetical protein CFOL_v3_32376 [Cephalotus follicularis]